MKELHTKSYTARMALNDNITNLITLKRRERLLRTVELQHKEYIERRNSQKDRDPYEF